MAQYYDLIRGLHILAVIAWMAALLYLPRLFVYHADAVPGSDKDDTFIVMERRLHKGIMTPAMVAAWIFGLALLDIRTDHFHHAELMRRPWLATKLGGVVIQTGWHHFLSANRKKFAERRNVRTARFWRLVNEIPFVVAIVMVIAATTEFGG